MSQLPSNSLSVSAETVRTLLGEADALASRSIDKMLEAGAMLVEAKAQCKHGEWLPFLVRAGIKARRAQQYMRLAESGLKSATIAQLGGVNGALEFLSRRRLPSAREGLCITPHSSVDNPFEAYEAAFIWPSRTAGFFHGAHFADDGDGGMRVSYSKRPISDAPLPGERDSMVWTFEERMATPVEDRHYHRLTLPQVFAIAEALGVVDTMYEASVEEYDKLEKAQSIRTLESLSDLYGDAIERMKELLGDRSVENYLAATSAMNACADAIQRCDDPQLLHTIAADGSFSRLSQKLDAALSDLSA